MNKYLTVAKVNFKKSTWIAYLVAGISVLAMITDLIVDVCLNNNTDSSISTYSLLYLICILAPILIASVNYSKFMNIGVNKKTYFYGCMINYVVFAAIVSVLGVLGHYLMDTRLVENEVYEEVLSLIGVFGWDSSVFTAFFSQFAFLLLVEVVIHTLTFMQAKWYGWVTDVLIITIISVFTPISALRQVEVFFFRFIIFEQPIIQIPVCLGLSILFYYTNLFYLKNRNNG